MSVATLMQAKQFLSELMQSVKDIQMKSWTICSRTYTTVLALWPRRPTILEHASSMAKRFWQFEKRSLGKLRPKTLGWLLPITRSILVGLWIKSITKLLRPKRIQFGCMKDYHTTQVIHELYHWSILGLHIGCLVIWIRLRRFWSRGCGRGRRCLVLTMLNHSGTPLPSALMMLPDTRVELDASCMH